MDKNGRTHDIDIRLDTWQKWAQIATAFAAMLALILTAIVSYMTIRLTSDLAYDYQGAQFCHDYRTEVYDLSKDKAVRPAAIEAILSKEEARAGYNHAYELLAQECGSVQEIVDLLSQKQP